MSSITQEARRRQGVVKPAKKKGKSFAARMYGVDLSSVKRWCNRYDGTWQSLKEKSHRPHSHPARHTAAEEKQIKECFKEKYLRYGWDGVYDALCKQGYTRSFSGMVYAAKRMGPGSEVAKRGSRRQDHRYPEILVPGEKVQEDVKEVPYNCLRGALKRDGKHLYQWTAIDKCTRLRFVYGFKEHTPENAGEQSEVLENACKGISFQNTSHSNR